MRVYHDVSVFSSPVKCLGSVSGVVECDEEPVEGKPFPWTGHLRPEDEPELIEMFEQTIVSSVNKEPPFLFGAEMNVMSDLVFHSKDEALTFSKILFDRLGMSLCEND